MSRKNEVNQNEVDFIYRQSLGISIPILMAIICTYYISGSYYLYNIFIEIFCASIGTALFIICTIRKEREANLYSYIGLGFFFISILSFAYALMLNTYGDTLVNELYPIFTFTCIILNYLVVIISFIIDRRSVRLKTSIAIYLIVTIGTIALNYILFYDFKSNKGSMPLYMIEAMILSALLLITLILFYLNRKKLAKEEKFYLYIYLFFILLHQILTYYNHFYTYELKFEVGMTKYIAYYVMFYAIAKLVLNKTYKDMKEDLEKAQEKQIEMNNKLSARNKMLIDCKSQIEKSEKRYGELIETIRDGIMIFYFDRLSYINQIAMDILDYKSDKEVIGRKFQNLLKDIISDEIYRKYYSRIYDSDFGENQGFKTENIVKGEEEYEVYLLKIDNLNKLVYIKDITEVNKTRQVRKEYEEYLKEEAVKNEFYSNISHELRTPINLIYSALQLNEMNLVENNITSIDKRNQVIKQNCLRLIRTINNFIDTNKISEGYLRANMKVYNIVSVIENISLECRSYLEKINSTLIFDSVEEEIYVECDKDMIERVMLNLLSNSVKYGRKGGKVLVDIQEDEDIIVIHVKNNGYTIEKSVQPYIFDKFTKINKSFNREKEGSGLGLFLVKALLELQGGNIELKSNSKIGSEFIIRLPRSYEEEKAEETDYEMNDIKERVDMEFSDIYL